MGNSSSSPSPSNFLLVADCRLHNLTSCSLRWPQATDSTAFEVARTNRPPVAIEQIVEEQLREINEFWVSRMPSGVQLHGVIVRRGALLSVASVASMFILAQSPPVGQMTDAKLAVYHCLLAVLLMGMGITAIGLCLLARLHVHVWALRRLLKAVSSQPRALHNRITWLLDTEPDTEEYPLPKDRGKMLYTVTAYQAPAQAEGSMSVSLLAVPVEVLHEEGGPSTVPSPQPLQQH